MTNLKDKWFFFFFSHGTTSCGIAKGYFGTKFFKMQDIKIDKNGCLVLLDAKVDHQSFVLLNVYNANIEKEQLVNLTELQC